MVTNPYISFTQQVRASPEWQAHGARLSFIEQGRLLGQMYRSGNRPTGGQQSYRAAAKKQKTKASLASGGGNSQPCEIVESSEWMNLKTPKHQLKPMSEQGKVLKASKEQDQFIGFCLGKIAFARRMVDGLGGDLPYSKPEGTIQFITNYTYKGSPKQMAFCSGPGQHNWVLKGTSYEFYMIV
jgi:hypothetical protein